MKTKILIVLLIVSVITLSIKFYLSSTTIQKQDTSIAQTIPLPQNTVDYLQNSLLYGNFYNEGQKFVIYFADDNKPIYPQKFLTELTQIQQEKNITSQYIFLPRSPNLTLETTAEKESDKNFVQLCHQFCIINPKTNEIFYISGVTEQDAQELSHLFNALLQW